MLALTDTAVDAIRDLVEGEHLPQDAGLRIAMKHGDEGALELSLTDGPEAGDQVIEKADARVFLDPTAAKILQNRALEADVPADGNPTFRLPRQAGG